MSGAADVVVFACGNPSRGDDALGPLLLSRLDDWLTENGFHERFVLVEDFQLQVEHALDLDGMTLALFIDAGIGTPAPFAFHETGADATPGHSSHALTPANVLAVHSRVGTEPAPAAFVLCVRGESFELGEPPGESALHHAYAAFALLQHLCRAPSLECWRGLADLRCARPEG